MVQCAMRSTIFRDMRSAPQDGTVVEVRHGPDQEIARAEWSGQNQAWVRADDTQRKTLHRVTGWRPMGQEITPAPPRMPPPGR